MGQKVNPNGMRVGINKDWNSTWFANKKDFAKYILEDNKLRKFITKKYSNCAISSIKIARTDARLTINITTGRPGMLIGVKGSGVEQMKKEIAKMTESKDVSINIIEVKKIDADASLIAQNIAAQLANRVSGKRAMKFAIQKAMRAGVKGIKIMVSGRQNGADIANSLVYSEGSVPLHTIRADIDYATAEGHTTFGVMGVKVWVYKGEILGKRPLREETPARAPRRKKEEK